MVARLRGYTGGSFTQMTHLVRPFREHVRASRARRAPNVPEHPEDRITNLAECDHDLEGVDLTLAARSGGRQRDRCAATTTQPHAVLPLRARDPAADRIAGYT